VDNLNYSFESGNEIHSLEMVFVEGTRGRPYVFGEKDASRNVEMRDFFISKFPVTQALWAHVMGVNPSLALGGHKPVENVSWLDVTGRGGFLERINASDILAAIERQLQDESGDRAGSPARQPRWGCRGAALESFSIAFRNRVGICSSRRPALGRRVPLQWKRRYRCSRVVPRQQWRLGPGVDTGIPPLGQEITNQNS
jgi:hypothetical protein